MIDVAYFGWLGTPATAVLLPVGQWAIALGLPLAGMIAYFGFRERVLARRVDVMSAIASVAAGAHDHSGVMLTAMNELCRLHGAKFAWFQMVEGEDWFSSSMWDSLTGSPSLAAGCLFAQRHHAAAEWTRGPRVSVRSLAPELRDDLEQAGMRYLLLVPVMGETALVGDSRLWHDWPALVHRGAAPISDDHGESVGRGG